MIKIVKSEEGSVVLLALMVLMLITMFGISALNTSDTELIVSHNNRCYKQNLYRAEGMVMEAAQKVNGTAAADLTPSSGTKPTWLVDGTVDSPDFNPESEAWEDNPYTEETVLAIVDPEKANFTVVYEGLSSGSSLSMDSTIKIWQYSIYGKSNLCNGELGVVAGFRREL